MQCLKNLPYVNKKHVWEHKSVACGINGHFLFKYYVSKLGGGDFSLRYGNYADIILERSPNNNNYYDKQS